MLALYSVVQCRETRETLVYEIMWKNVVEPEMPQMTKYYMAHALCYKHILRIRNSYCFYSATMVTRTRLNVTSYVHCVSYVNQEIVSRV